MKKSFLLSKTLNSFQIDYIDETTIDNIESTIAGSDNSNMVTPESGANDFMARLHENMKHAGEITGIKIGDNFKNLTSLINGLQGKKLITISANQSVGKTTISINSSSKIGSLMNKSYSMK